MILAMPSDDWLTARQLARMYRLPNQRINELGRLGVIRRRVERRVIDRRGRGANVFVYSHWELFKDLERRRRIARTDYGQLRPVKELAKRYGLHKTTLHKWALRCPALRRPARSEVLPIRDSNGAIRKALHLDEEDVRQAVSHLRK